MKIDEFFFCDKLDLIERHILSILHSPILVQNAQVAFLTAFLNATLLFVYEELRECPRWTNVAICLSERIRSGLGMVDLWSGEIGDVGDLVVWMLLLGRSGCLPVLGGGESGAMEWFEERIAVVVGERLTVPARVQGLKYFEIAESVRGGGEEREVDDEGTENVDDREMEESEDEDEDEDENE